jgi:hypothetical protein
VWTGDKYANTTNFSVDNDCDYREVIAKRVLEERGFTCLKDGLNLSTIYHSDTRKSRLGMAKAFCEQPLISAFTAITIANEYLDQMDDLYILPEQEM